MGNAWRGWVAFAGWLLVIVGTLDAFEGLIAIFRDKYYVFTPQQIIVFDVTTWGWVMLAWGIIVALGGLGLLSGASWARWFAIFVGSLGFIFQLGFLGASPYPIWTLTVLGLQLVVLYALIARWEEATRPV